MLRFVLFTTALFIGVVSLFSQTTLPSNMYADSAYAPFYYGVASGTPTPSSIIIWTHVTPASINDTITIDWEMATDTAFTNIVGSGSISTEASVDHTVETEVTGLNANSTYYYRFVSNGVNGRVGRTRTAPDGATDEMKVAVISCSSIFSGYFNAYARLAEREDLNMILHLGDYIYDFVDPDEQIRLPSPLLPDPSNLTEYRDQHKYYLLDPDLRAARQQHPWIAIWDNHDVEGTEANTYNGSVQVFYEYLPIKPIDNNDPYRIYNSYSFGGMMDLFMVDINLNRDEDTLPSGAYSAMGTDQRNWLFNELDQSTATWKVLGNQKLFSRLDLVGTSLPLSKWDDYSEERIMIMDHLAQNNIDNTVVVSGDAHMSFMIDISTDPHGANGIYDTLTGDGAVGMEMLASSISRGNLDETAGVNMGLAEAIQGGALIANPSYRILNMIDHGYGLMTLRPDSITAEFYFSDVLSQTTTEYFGGGVVAYKGENHWRRTVYDRSLEVRDNDTISGITLSELVSDKLQMTIAPNPNKGQFKILLNNLKGNTAKLDILDIAGRRVLTKKLTVQPGNRTEVMDLTDLPSGIYVVQLLNQGQKAETSLVIRRN